MIKLSVSHVFLMITLFCSSPVVAQKAKDLSKVKTMDQALAFIEKYPHPDARILVFNSGKDSFDVFQPYYQMKPDSVFQIDSIQYKVLQVDSLPAIRFCYFGVCSERMSGSRIDSIRTEKIVSYKSGKSFAELIREEFADSDGTGDSGWVAENYILPGVRTAVRSHKTGDIFMADAPEINCYYVVLKTHGEGFIKTVKILSAGVFP